MVMPIRKSKPLTGWKAGQVMPSVTRVGTIRRHPHQWSRWFPDDGGWGRYCTTPSCFKGERRKTISKTVMYRLKNPL